MWPIPSPTRFAQKSSRRSSASLNKPSLTLPKRHPRRRNRPMDAQGWRRRLRWAAAVAVLWACAGPVAQPAAVALETGSEEFRVILIEDSFIYMNAGRDRGVQVGALFVVERPGKAVVDPETGDTLGHEPVAIAKLRVQYAAPHYARTYAMEVLEGVPVQIKDRVARWSGEAVGRVPAPAVMGIEVEEPRRAAGEGDKIFTEEKRRKGDIVGDFEVEGEVIDYDFGDVDGDGMPELVALEERRIAVYRISAGAPEEIWQEKLRGYQFVALELYDADADGKAEIYVGQKHGNTGRTDVYRHRSE